MMFFSKKDPLPPKNSLPPKNNSPFDKKKDWHRSDFIREISKTPVRPKTLYGTSFSIPQEKKLWGEIFPQKRFGSYISEQEVRKRLRELRREEVFAKTYAEKKRLSKLRDYLEKETGLHGKY